MLKIGDDFFFPLPHPFCSVIGYNASQSQAKFYHSYEHLLTSRNTNKVIQTVVFIALLPKYLQLSAFWTKDSFIFASTRPSRRQLTFSFFQDNKQCSRSWLLCQRGSQDDSHAEQTLSGHE